MASKSDKRKQPAVKYVVLTKPYLEKLASKIQSHYHLILINLGMKKHMLDQIEHDNNCVNQKILKGLLEWQRQFEGKGETHMILRLAEALFDVDRHDLYKDLEKKHQEQQRYQKEEEDQRRQQQEDEEEEEERQRQQQENEEQELRQRRQWEEEDDEEEERRRRRQWEEEEEQVMQQLEEEERQRQEEEDEEEEE